MGMPNLLGLQDQIEATPIMIVLLKIGLSAFVAMLISAVGAGANN